MKQQSTTKSADSQLLLEKTSWYLFVAASAAIGLVGVVMLIIRPRFAKIFEDFAVSLPSGLAWLIQSPSWLVVVFAVGWWIALFVKARKGWSPWLKAVINGVSFVAAFGLLGLFAVAALSGVRTLIEDLSG